MKKSILAFLTIAISVFSLAYTQVPAWAGTDNKDCVDTAILGNGGQYCDSGSGSGVLHILNLVADIMTIGIGILGVIGISVVGIQYLTAGGSEEKTRKAKRRMLEIIIGLAAYAVFYAILKWLGVNPTS